MRGRRSHPALLLAVALAVLLAAAGCGSQKTSAPTTSTTAPATTTEPAEGTMPLTVYEIQKGVLVPTTVHVKQTQAVASAALAALGLPAKVTLEAGGTAVVRLAHVTPAEAAEVVFTLTQFPSVQQVDVGGRHGLTRADVGSFAPLILVETPAAGASVGPQIRILGTAEVFEATLVVQLFQKGKLIEEKTVTASAGAPQRGVFTTELNATEAGPATIVAYSPSAEDGSHQHEVRIPVTVAA